MNNETALERLSKITNEGSFATYFNSKQGSMFMVEDIQEVVALAKSNQAPSIDAMRFEAAKVALQGILSSGTRMFFPERNANDAVLCADALINALQKKKP